MLTIKFNGKEYSNISESWGELKLSTFLQIEQLKNEMATIEDPIERIMLSYEVYSILIGCPVEFIANLKMEDMDTFLDAFKWVFETPPNKINYKFIIDGQLYSVREDFTEYTNAEVISIQTILENKIGIDNDVIPLILSIIIRPSIETIDDFGKKVIKQAPLDKLSVIKERANLIKNNLSVEEVWGILVFFYNGGKTSSKTIPTSNQKKQSQSFQIVKEKQKKKEKGNVLKK
jgi:hypothetical protein